MQVTQVSPPGWYPSVQPGALRYWDGRAWTTHTTATPLMDIPDATNHVLHLLLTVVTFGLWAPAWVWIAWSNRSSRNAAIHRAPGVH
jgi:hypothetical protein